MYRINKNLILSFVLTASIIGLSVVCADAVWSYPSLPMPSSGDSYQISTKHTVLIPCPANLDNDDYLDWVISGLTEGTEVAMLEARDYYGKLLWEHDTGVDRAATRNGHGGRHNLATVVGNFKQDTPWDEVVYVRYMEDPPSIVMLDGKTGDVLVKKPFPYRGGGDSTRYGCSMYWNGKLYIVVGQSVCQNGRVSAFDENLNEVWRYDCPYSSTGHHGLNSYDLDGDGNEEILYGGTTLDSNGTELWSLNKMFGYGHIDSVNPGDLIPGNGKKEIYYAAEEGDAVLIVDQNGTVIWHWRDPHNRSGGGLTGVSYDFDANYPGAECIVNYDDCDDYPDFPCGTPEENIILSSEGKVIRNASYYEKRGRWPEWTGDEIYDVDKCPYYEAGRSYGADLGGGDNHGAEELIKSYFPSDNPPKRIEVYFNKSAKSYPSRWQNRHYRQDVMRVASGYTLSKDTFQVQDDSGQPIASFTAIPETGEVPLSVNFDASQSTDPDGSIVSYSWDFDASDGIQQDAAGKTTSHTFNIAKTYTVTLTVTDNESKTGQTTKNIIVTTSDTTPPSVESVTVVSSTKIDIKFNETVEQTSSETENNYTINNGIGKPSSAILDSDLKTAHLTVSALQEEMTYTITACNIKDRAKNPNTMGCENKNFVITGTVIVSNIVVGSAKAYVSAILNEGDVYYIDRAYTISNLPDGMEGLTWVKTANDDKGTSGDNFLSFDIDRNAKVYIGYDTRNTTLPSWLNSWTLETGKQVQDSSGVTFQLYSKNYSQGNVSLGGGYAYSNNMYIVILESRGGGGPSYMKEDINQDGQVNVVDVQLCVNVFLGTETNPDIVARADVNDDGSVNVIDVQRIVNVFLEV